jgi:glycogen debranching enzyme
MNLDNAPQTSAADTQSVPAQFHIPAATSLQERRFRTLKHGDTFAMFDYNGDATSGPTRPDGIYHRDTRHLDHLRLLVCGAHPMLLSSTIRDDHATLTCDLTNPELVDGGRLILGHDLIHVRRSKYLWNATCFERIAIRNFDEKQQRVVVRVEFSADFVDLFEVRGTPRAKRGVLHEPAITGDSVTLSYTGLDGKVRATRLRFEPQPSRLTGDYAEFTFDVPSHDWAQAFVEMDCAPKPCAASPRARFLRSLRDARRNLRSLASRAAGIESSNEIFNAAMRRAVSDLYMLVTTLPEGSYPYAGIPWFSTVFGRDALIASLHTLWLDPSIARGVLGHLAANQAQHIDAAADAEPGKILHEVRHGEMAELGEVPFRRYYGSVDSTPLFVLLAGAYFERTGDMAFLRTLWPHIEAALSWIDHYGDRDGDGFVEYGRQSSEGLINQGWKDSHDSIFHADGTLAAGPVAVVEVQAYTYAGKRSAAALARKLGHEARAVALDQQADELRRNFDAAFWDEELGTYVIALDGAKRPCRVRASNAGHALFTGIAFRHRAERLVPNLMGTTHFSGWGIRTLAVNEPRYNPMSYHNGSVWPHDNALIATGFARYGYAAQAARVLEGLFDASTHIELWRLPELFCGFSRQPGQGPTYYPVACSPQAWSATSLLSLVQACLGLGIEVETRSVSFTHPVLPNFVSEITLCGLAIGDASIDVVLRRAGSEVAAHVLQRHGDIRLIMVS